eukprot:scaffold16882_cov487-Ochromonas_danica.AAC.1
MNKSIAPVTLLVLLMFCWAQQSRAFLFQFPCLAGFSHHPDCYDVQEEKTSSLSSRPDSRLFAFTQLDRPMSRALASVADDFRDFFDHSFDDPWPLTPSPFFRSASRRPTSSSVWTSLNNNILPMDVEELEDRYELVLELPGVRKEDVDVSVKGKQLIIQAERKLSNKQQTAPTDRMKKSEKEKAEGSETVTSAAVKAEGEGEAKQPS